MQQSATTLAEALSLATETLRQIELSEIPLGSIVLKASRLKRLLGDRDHQLAFEYEASGYPTTPDGIEYEVFEIARLAGRIYLEKSKDGTEVERATIEAVEVLGQRAATSRSALEAAADPNVSVSSSNPRQFVSSPPGNARERAELHNRIVEDTKLLAARRAFVHRYVSATYDELRFSGIAGDIFSRIRTSVDTAIGEAVPKAAQKFASVYENLRSDNPEDWANAVHSCRRILQELADAKFPPVEDRVLAGRKSIKLGHDNYINRLMCFIEDNSDSDRFRSIVGTTLSYVGERLDAAFKSAQKGSHSEIASREEADRYVVYTYMLVADILSLAPRGNSASTKVHGLATVDGSRASLATSSAVARKGDE